MISMLTQNEFTILNTIRKKGKLSYRELSKITNYSIGNITNIIKQLKEKEYLNDGLLTKKAMCELSNYKVDNAVILAAGPSSRFVPLSLELPKGLFKVKDSVLIERLIEQLLEAGIKKITVVLGYKKEAFFYLKDKYKMVDFIINNQYNIKNNIYSLYVAQKELKSTYICHCDTYYLINPFDVYEYSSYYSAMYTNEPSKEMYANINNKKIITSMSKGNQEGYILIGHSYWNNSFSQSFIKLMNQFSITNQYDNEFWEKMVADHLDKLPFFSIKEFSKNTIFEFDCVEELRAFDKKYINDTDSYIMKNICHTFNCEEKDIYNFKPIDEGMTNTSFVFTYQNQKYVYRQPGEGTENIINRVHEKKSLEFAKKNHFDMTYVYMNELEGWKISQFVPEFREPNYNDYNDTKIIVDILQKLHSTNHEDIDWIFDPIKEAEKLEEIIKNKTIIQMNDFEELKSDICFIYKNVENDGIKKCFCHCDTYKHNWMFIKNGAILIDWEYASISDPGVDIGYYIVDGLYEPDDAITIIKEYCKESYDETKQYHYLAYTAIIAYYWFVWALYKESCGTVIGESLYNWYKAAKKYSKYVLNNLSLYNKVLNRCEFEILKYFSENMDCNNYRKLGNLLGISTGTVQKYIIKMLDVNELQLSNGKVFITDKGYKKLERYKVNRAIIMAAGFGSRMVPITLKTPKPLVTVNGKRIIDTLIDSLILKGINEIYIIRGYKKECFDELTEKYPFIKFIDNDEYNITNNISSLMKAIDLIDNCYICEADFLVSNPNIISKYNYCSNYLGAKVIETDDWCFKSKNGYAYDYKKGDTNCYQAYGISYWNKKDSQKLREKLPIIFATDKGKQEFWESCVFDYYNTVFDVEIKECSKNDIVEIDNFYELAEIDSSYLNYKC